tara:strand:- start:4 stop:1575 length:1572 start_codon:yes stop_codon:yes gene_type:complete
MDSFDKLVEKHFPQTGPLQMLMEMIEKELSLLEQQEVVSEQEGRFSFSIPIPKLIPSEAWGDPSSQSRKDVERVFASITRQPSIKARIDHVNSFLDPKQAIRKAPGGKVNAVLNMMQIIESLQAALNDYNESSAGFVFEGFMAALTGGRQEAGRVGGTLPIEDFVTGDNENVSLKLLSPNTPIHGSFTNLIDYLFIRGEAGVPSIKYLIAYKDSENDAVAKLAFWDFEINRDNVVDILVLSNNENLLGKTANAMKQHVGSWSDSAEWKTKMRDLLSNSPGYSDRGMFYKNLTDDGEFTIRPDAEPDPAVKQKQYQLMLKQGRLDQLLAAATEAGAKAAGAGGETFEDWVENLDLTDLPASLKSKTRIDFFKKLKANWDKGAKAASEEVAVSESYFGVFHEDEKKHLREELLFEAGSQGEKKSQFSITRSDMAKIRSIADTRFYGELNMGQDNINELVKIYVEKIGEDLMKLLETTKNFSENIGRYFSADDRTEAVQANQQAIAQGGQIITSLAADPAGAKEET